MKTKKENYKLSKDFWIKGIPTLTKKQSNEDMIPFEWNENELPEKAKKILFTNEENTK